MRKHAKRGLLPAKTRDLRGACDHVCVMCVCRQGCTRARGRGCTAAAGRCGARQGVGSCSVHGGGGGGGGGGGLTVYGGSDAEQQVVVLGVANVALLEGARRHAGPPVVTGLVVAHGAGIRAQTWAGALQAAFCTGFARRCVRGVFPSRAIALDCRRAVQPGALERKIAPQGTCERCATATLCTKRCVCKPGTT